MSDPLPLSALHPTTRARLEALAVEWLGFDPWVSGESMEWSDNADQYLPLHLGAGYDLGVRLAAEALDTNTVWLGQYLRGDIGGAERFYTEARTRYDAIKSPAARLRAILLDLGRE